jgi:hypothetical protein
VGAVFDFSSNHLIGMPTAVLMLPPSAVDVEKIINRELLPIILIRHYFYDYLAQ